MDKNKGKEARLLVQEFDTRLLEAREYDSWLYKVPFYFLEIMFIMISFISDTEVMFWVGNVGYAFSICLEMGSYLKFQGQSVYGLLAYYPVKKQDIFCVRLGYLKDKLIKRLIFLYLIQVPWMIYHRGVTENNIMIPITLVFTALLCGIVEILPGLRKGEEK